MAILTYQQLVAEQRRHYESKGYRYADEAPMTPEPITFTRSTGHSEDGRPYEIITADRFPDFIAVADEVLAQADRQVLWVDGRGLLNIRAANGWATYRQTHCRPESRQCEYVCVARHLEPRS